MKLFLLVFSIALNMLMAYGIARRDEAIHEYRGLIERALKVCQ